MSCSRAQSPWKKLATFAAGTIVALSLAACSVDEDTADQGAPSREAQAATEVTVEDVKKVFPKNEDPLLAGYGTDSGYIVSTGEDLAHGLSRMPMAGPDSSEECVQAQQAWEEEVAQMSFSSSTAHALDPNDVLNHVEVELFGGEFPHAKKLQVTAQIVCLGEPGSEITPIEGDQVFTFHLYGADNTFTVVTKTANGITAAARSGAMPREQLEQLVDGMLERSTQLPVAHSEEI